MTASIDSTELRERIIAGGEFALIDVRESGLFSHGHLLTACNLPLSRLELGIVTLLPRKATFVVLTDGGDGLAGRAAGVLQTMGYGNIAIHEGGVEAWRAAGGEVFEGINVPSKAFGECVESACATPALGAAEVHSRIAAGDDIIVLDGRPFGEYVDFAIPGAFSCPNSELARHITDLAPSSSTTVVVNCAGRTRSIIGAQTLRNTGLANPVHSLENGTIGWEWAGQTLEFGAGRRPGGVSESSRAWGVRACRSMASATGLGEIDDATLGDWLKDDSRTLYRFDVRSPEEHARGVLAGMTAIEGTQLIQQTDSWVAVRDARIVLGDDCGTRSRFAGHWLKQMGYRDVHVLDTDEVLPVQSTPPDAPMVQPGDAAADGWTILDLSTSLQYMSCHPAGAFWALRSRLAGCAPAADRGLAIFDDEGGHLAALAVADLAGLGIGARVMEGGLEAWIAAGLPVASGYEGALCAMDDQGEAPFEIFDDPDGAKRRYIAWEKGLPAQIERDGLLSFRPMTVTTS
ncbi:MAG: rhodanese-like domain-containing protein [bacterium]|nr:rhodanese-like domain-containing protein [bacterium]MDE0416233.1 rhodanese-like domain-containing protein [bacterium]